MISVKDIKELQKSAKARRTSGLFIAEGRKMFSEVPPSLIEQLCVSETFAGENPLLIEEKSQSCELMILSDSRFAALSDTKTPQGVLSVLKTPAWRTEEILSKKAPFVLVLENLQDPGNAGTILRTAEAAGVDGVFLTEGSVDMYNPKTIRSTMGAIYRVPHKVVSDVDDLLDTFRSRGITTYAAALDGRQVYLEPDYTGGCAFLIGNESQGLSDELQGKCDCPIIIPMKGRIESLNAAMAAGILMYEAARQRM